MSSAKAIPVTFYVKITLSDTCSPSYHGYYCVRLNLTYDSNPICTSQICTITGTGCYAFNCNLDELASDPKYGVELVIAYRYPSGSCSTTIGTGSGGMSWSDMTDSSCVATLSVVL